jgi:hypothetical protein
VRSAHADVDIGDHDAGALSDQGARERPSEADGAAGDDGRAVVESHT